MSTTNDTSAIDDKKNEQSETNIDKNYASNAADFVKNTLFTCLFVFAYFSLGGIILSLIHI